jgi:hypothetical protein
MVEHGALACSGSRTRRERRPSLGKGQEEGKEDEGGGEECMAVWLWSLSRPWHACLFCGGVWLGAEMGGRVEERATKHVA